MTVFRIERYSETEEAWQEVRIRGKSFFFDVDKAIASAASVDGNTRVVEEELFDGDIIRWRVVNA